jgi:hypothetical protein
MAMKRAAPWRTRAERASALRASDDRELVSHVLLSKHVIDDSRAVFEIGQPESSTFYAEVACLRSGVFVHGDVESVIFERCSYKLWREKLSWMRGHNPDYAEEKAHIGASNAAMASVVDIDVAIGDLLWWRREGTLGKEDTVDVYSLLTRDGDVHEAQALLYERTGDAEMRLGWCTASRVIMAQAVITKLCSLLAENGEEYFSP